MTYLLIFLGFAARLLPHPANLTPVGAIGIFGGAHLPKRLALALPLVALLLSDLVLGFYTWQVMVSVYGGFLVYGLAGLWIRQDYSIKRMVVGTLGASVFFFLLTNAAVWAFTPLYPHTIAGLGASYLAALPFFRNSLLGDFFYTAALFGVYELTHSLRGSTVKLHYDGITKN
ncbi:hypothetical protein HYZ64_03375 [Candidatus Berkelbacteria bacterium]|nr:hypothetical protein [Candidatus Berkelbacteria bacterium]